MAEDKLPPPPAEDEDVEDIVVEEHPQDTKENSSVFVRWFRFLRLIAYVFAALLVLFPTSAYYVLGGPLEVVGRVLWNRYASGLPLWLVGHDFLTVFIGAWLISRLTVAITSRFID